MRQFADSLYAKLRQLSMTAAPSIATAIASTTAPFMLCRYSLATLKRNGSWIPPSKAALLGAAVNAACDTLDGVADGVLEDPRRCDFDAAKLVR